MAALVPYNQRVLPKLDNISRKKVISKESISTRTQGGLIRKQKKQEQLQCSVVYRQQTDTIRVRMSGCLSPAKHGTNIDDARVFLKGLRSISLRNLTVRYDAKDCVYCSSVSFVISTCSVLSVPYGQHRFIAGSIC